MQARRIGYPLNTFITVNFADVRCPADKCSFHLRSLRNNRLSPTLSRSDKNGRRACPPTYLFVFENVRDGRALKADENHNIHAHLLIHVPRSRLRDVKMAVWGYLEGAFGDKIPETVVDIEPIPEHDADTVSRYCRKGAHPSYANIYGVDAAPQGEIIGKRSGVSRNIGPKNRRKMDRERGVRRSFPSPPISRL